MATARQIAANRANAKKSTGPRTPEGKAIVARNGARSRGPKTAAGKARSRWNALKHGLRARTLIPDPLLARESPEFAALYARLRAQYAPATPLAEALVGSLAQNCWRLNRLVRLEAEVLGGEASPALDTDLLLRYEAPLRRQIASALDLLERIRRSGGLFAAGGDRAPSETHSLPNEPKPIRACPGPPPGSPGMHMLPNEPKPIHARRKRRRPRKRRKL